MESSDTGKTLAGMEQTLSEQQEQLDTQARQMAAKQARLSQFRQQAGDRQRAGKLAQLRERTVNMLQAQQTDLSTLRTTYAEKEKELTSAVLKIEAFWKEHARLQEAAVVQLQLQRLEQNIKRQNRVNELQRFLVKTQQQVLLQKRDELNNVKMQIALLQNKLHLKSGEPLSSQPTTPTLASDVRSRRMADVNALAKFSDEFSAKLNKGGLSVHQNTAGLFNSSETPATVLISQEEKQRDSQQYASSSSGSRSLGSTSSTCSTDSNLSNVFKENSIDQEPYAPHSSTSQRSVSSSSCPRSSESSEIFPGSISAAAGGENFFSEVLKAIDDVQRSSHNADLERATSFIDKSQAEDSHEFNEGRQTSVESSTLPSSIAPPLRYTSKSPITNAYAKRLSPSGLSQLNTITAALYAKTPNAVARLSALSSFELPQTPVDSNTPVGMRRRAMSNRNRSNNAADDQNNENRRHSFSDSVYPQGFGGEKYSCRPNAPRSVRRRSLSCEDDLIGMSHPHPIDIPQMVKEESYTNLEDALSSEPLNQDQGAATFTKSAATQPQVEDSKKTSLVPDSAEELSFVDGVQKEIKTCVLKRQEGSSRKTSRVSFNPLALLLDAAMEGDLDLVKRVITQVTDPSKPNEEGVTALHNAVCGGHVAIVQFLIDCGCNVNAPDTDGWTPLHCAASCNNLAIVKVLVKNGAAVFATTIGEQETPSQKCEEGEEGYRSCLRYLREAESSLGTGNGGLTYAVFDYQAEHPDELSFKAGDIIMVRRKGDEFENNWWWAKTGDVEGYVARTLLGLYPRNKGTSLTADRD